MPWLLLLLPFSFFFSTSAHPHQSSIPIKSNQTLWSSLYTVSIKTSCSSVPYTTDKISLAFGDAYGNEVNEPRIDDPSTRKFERCSTYVFDIRGTYIDIVCYIAVSRNGSDGWKPESVEIYGPNHNKPIIFIIDIFLVNQMWFNMDVCTYDSQSPLFMHYLRRNFF